MEWVMKRMKNWEGESKQYINKHTDLMRERERVGEMKRMEGCQIQTEIHTDVEVEERTRGMLNIDGYINTQINTREMEC